MRRRSEWSRAKRMVAGALLLALVLTPLAPAFAAPTPNVHCLPPAATLDSGGTHEMPCHTGDMSGCTHAVTCAVSAPAVLPVSMPVQPAERPSSWSLPLVPAWHQRLGFKPPTPPPNA